MNDQQTINVLKGLVIDGVHKANSGHPGGAMSSMDFAYLLFTEYLQFDPNDPKWPGRDRFVLSAGHESMLLYSLFNLMGWLEMDELKRFRQLHSRTPGHPENFITDGVECTTGPLGQGAAMSVGFSIASTHFSATLDDQLFDQKVYALLGDGCMQEDVTLGAASYAGHLKLPNLVWYYDRNRIQISGQIDRSTSDDERKIFEGFGWQVLEVDGHNHTELRKALDAVQKPQAKPTLIIGNTTIAHGADSMEGSHKTHGSPFPAGERLATKAKLNLPQDQDFYRPDDAVAHFRRNFAKNEQKAKAWRERLAKKQSDVAFSNSYSGRFGTPDHEALPAISWKADQPIATRNCFGEIIAAWAEALPGLMGGSADLEPSNMTGAFAELVGDYQADSRQGRNFAFGVREFPMSAVCNGLGLYGGIIPFDATFLTFSDYSRAALRLGALQKVGVIHEFTHDSFYLGEDGPTHQAIEHAMSLRLIPDFYVMRPGDALETEIMMRQAVRLRNFPTALLLSRQKLPVLDLNDQQKSDCAKGAYILHAGRDPKYVIFATGSEVSLALDAVKVWGSDEVRVVSVPCWELFDRQPDSYRDQVLSRNIPNRVSIEAGVTLGWQRFTGERGLCIGVDHFGASAPAEDLAKEYGFTADAVCERMRQHFR